MHHSRDFSQTNYVSFIHLVTDLFLQTYIKFSSMLKSVLLYRNGPPYIQDFKEVINSVRLASIDIV